MKKNGKEVFLGGKRNKGRRGEGRGAAGGEKEKIKKRERGGKRDEGRAFTFHPTLPICRATCVGQTHVTCVDSTATLYTRKAMCIQCHALRSSTMVLILRTRQEGGKWREKRGGKVGKIRGRLG